MRFGYGVSISPTRTVTPEGYLICQGCRIARIGGREYAPDEITEVKPSADGKITVIRSSESLFSPETINSFEGKPVSLEHPPGVEMFDANTWKNWIVGVMLHVARGEGEDAGCLVADIILYDPAAINAVMSEEMTELSLGYRSQITDIGNGTGVESPLSGNHVALVPKGRCGSYCAIKDSAQTKTGEKMFFPKKDADPAPAETGDGEALKALQEQINALQEQIAAMKGQSVADEDPKEEPKLDEEDPKAAEPKQGDEQNQAEEPKTDEEEPAAFEATPEAIAAIVNKVLEAREAQAVVDEEVKKDAATVAPSLDASTPNLAMQALAQYGKTSRGRAVLAEFGGLKAIKKDAAATVLKSCAIAERLNAKSSFGEGKKDADQSRVSTARSYFEQARKIWN